MFFHRLCFGLISLVCRCSFMFVLEANATSVAALSLDAPGQAKSVGNFDLAGPAKASGLTISMPLILCTAAT